MNKRDVRERILEIFEDSETDIASWDPEVRDELAEAIATAVTKLEMETIFDEDIAEDEGDDDDVVF